MIRQCSEFDNLRALVLLYNAIVRSNLEYNFTLLTELDVA
jgi:hypothetical protein